MVGSVTKGITKLDSVCRHMSMDAQADELNTISKRLNKHVFSVGVIGQIKTQYPALKTSALNSLSVAFKDLTEKAKLQVTEYFDKQTREFERKAEESAAVARKDSESKAEIRSALDEMKNTLSSIKESFISCEA